MSTDLPRILFERHRQPFVGFRTTLHFWERFVQRFGNNPNAISGLFNAVDSELIFLFYDAAQNEPTNMIKFRHKNVTIPMQLHSNSNHHFIKALTIF